MERIQYSLILHLREVQELGIDIGLTDLVIFEFLRSFETKTYCKKEKLDDEQIYFWVSHELIMKQLPILGIKTKRGIIDRINNLVNIGLLIRYTSPKGVNKSYYRFTALADRFDSGCSCEQNFTPPVNKTSHPCEQNFTPPVNKTSHPCEQNFTPPVNKTSHNNIQDIQEQEDKNTIIPPLSPDGEISTNKGEKKKPKDVVEDFIETSVEESFKSIMRDWCAYKREKGQSYKPTGLKACYAKLLKLSNSNSDTARQIIEQSMASNWAGLFALKSGYAKKEPIGIILRNNTDDKYLNQKIKQWK